MIRRVFYDQDVAEYFKKLKTKNKKHYSQHLEIIRRICKSLATDAELKHGVSKIHDRINSYYIDIEAELLDKVYPPEGYRIRFEVQASEIFVSSVTFTDLSI